MIIKVVDSTLSHTRNPFLSQVPSSANLQVFLKGLYCNSSTTPLHMSKISDVEIDLIPLERKLKDLSVSIRDADKDEYWTSVQTTSRELANYLRARNASSELHYLCPAYPYLHLLEDHHTILGKTELPQTLVYLLSRCLRDSHIPNDNRTAAVFELLRVGANFCMDHSK